MRSYRREQLVDQISRHLRRETHVLRLVFVRQFVDLNLRVDVGQLDDLAKSEYIEHSIPHAKHRLEFLEEEVLFVVFDLASHVGDEAR